MKNYEEMSAYEKYLALQVILAFNYHNKDKIQKLSRSYGRAYVANAIMNEDPVKDISELMDLAKSREYLKVLCQLKIENTNLWSDEEIRSIAEAMGLVIYTAMDSFTALTTSIKEKVSKDASKSLDFETAEKVEIPTVNRVSATVADIARQQAEDYLGKSLYSCSVTPHEFEELAESICMEEWKTAITLLAIDRLQCFTDDQVNILEQYMGVHRRYLDTFNRACLVRAYVLEKYCEDLDFYS